MSPQLKAEIGELNSYYLSLYGTNRNYATEHLLKEPFYCVLWFCIEVRHFSDAPLSSVRTCAPQGRDFCRGSERAVPKATLLKAQPVLWEGWSLSFEAVFVFCL